MHQFLKFILGMKLYMFRTVTLSIIRSFSLYIHSNDICHRSADSLRARSGWNSIFLAVTWSLVLELQRSKDFPVQTGTYDHLLSFNWSKDIAEDPIWVELVNM
jgi:hypothetical protein